MAIFVSRAALSLSSPLPPEGSLPLPAVLHQWKAAELLEDAAWFSGESADLSAVAFHQQISSEWLRLKTYGAAAFRGFTIHKPERMSLA